MRNFLPNTGGSLDRVQTYDLSMETFGSLLCDGQQWQQVHHTKEQQEMTPAAETTMKNPGFWSFENMK